MKILYVFPYNPANPTFGGALRIYHILRHLCTHHDVTVVGFSTLEKEQELVTEFPSLAGKTHFIPPSGSPLRYRWVMLKSLFSRHSHWNRYSRSEPLQQKIDALLERESFDIIHCEFPVMAMYRFRSNAKRVLDCHNVEYDNFLRMSRTPNLIRKAFYRYEAAKFRREELDVCRQQDALFVTSERDISIFDSSLPRVRKFLVPNGVDRQYFTPTGIEPVPHSLVFVGMMKYLPNDDGMTFFLDEIFPKVLQKYPDTTLTIVGKNPSRSIRNRANDQIIVTGFVEDTRPYVDNASVYVVPLRMGGGTRLKILEALSMKKPIVTTSIGSEGIDVKDGETALIADQPDHFAEAICKLFEDPKQVDQLVSNGSNLADTYRWEAIGDSIEDAYQSLMKG
ncbi:MAG: glycosyltransferase family 4 protein [Balneolaceae bacterium]